MVIVVVFVYFLTYSTVLLTAQPTISPSPDGNALIINTLNGSFLINPTNEVQLINLVNGLETLQAAFANLSNNYNKLVSANVVLNNTVYSLQNSIAVSTATLNELNISLIKLACTDKIQNFAETGIDCGSEICGICANTQTNPAISVLALAPYKVKGFYWIKTPSMTTATQYWVNFDTAAGPMARIFIALMDYANPPCSWPVAESANLIQDSVPNFMYSFTSDNNDTLLQPWSFTLVGNKTNSAFQMFKTTPPTCHLPPSPAIDNTLITQVNAVRLTDGTMTQQYLRTGTSSFGGMCDDSRGGLWGQICLKAGNSASLGIGASSGFSDFPHYNSFATGAYTYDFCVRSDERYQPPGNPNPYGGTFNPAACNATKRFAVYVQ